MPTPGCTGSTWGDDRLSHRDDRHVSIHFSQSSKKLELAFAIADGKSIADWAVKNDVPRRTAYRWACEPKVRAKVASCRRFTLDQALGVLSNRVTRGADGIAELADNAVSESVRLAAIRPQIWVRSCLRPN